MKALNRPSCDELRNARKAGMKRKAPKKPGAKSYNALENYLRRYSDWSKDVKTAAAKGRKFDELKKAVRETGK